jgi:lipoyl(octanoyl) transferase
MTTNTHPLPDIEWRLSDDLVPYEVALTEMEQRARDIADGHARELIWLLEHPPLYTAGTSAVPDEMIDPRFPVYVAGRGGRYTYHGPGQRVVYVLINLKNRRQDIRLFVHALEEWVIESLAQLGISGRREDGRVGIWTDDNGLDSKIGAIGVRVRRWVTYHGFSINVDPDLSHFNGIIPCGLPDFGVTSVQKLGINSHMGDLDDALSHCFYSFIEKIS